MSKFQDIEPSGSSKRINWKCHFDKIEILLRKVIFDWNNYSVVAIRWRSGQETTLPRWRLRIQSPLEAKEDSVFIKIFYSEEVFTRDGIRSIQKNWMLIATIKQVKTSSSIQNSNQVAINWFECKSSNRTDLKSSQLNHITIQKEANNQE